MSRFGDVYENKVTRECAVVLRGSDDGAGGPAVAHLLARPGAAVIGEHVHPHIRERFTVVRGHLTARIAGVTRTLGPGESATVEAGVPHDWWNASSSEEAHVVVEIDRAPEAPNYDLRRFELLIGMLFGLANDGKTDRKGRPYPLQASLIAREFADVVLFTHPPLPVQKALIGMLAPVATLLGYEPTYERYAHPHGHIEPDPAVVAAARLAVSQQA